MAWVPARTNPGESYIKPVPINAPPTSSFKQQPQPQQPQPIQYVGPPQKTGIWAGHDEELMARQRADSARDTAAYNASLAAASSSQPASPAGPVDTGGTGSGASGSGAPLGQIATYQGPSGTSNAALSGLMSGGPVQQPTQGAPQGVGTMFQQPRSNLGQRMPPSLAGLLQVRAY